MWELGKEGEKARVERGKTGKTLLTDFAFSFMLLVYFILGHFLSCWKSVYLYVFFVTVLKMP